MTGLSRAAERAARRQRRRESARTVVAGCCVVAGVIVFVTARVGHGDDSAAAARPAVHPHSHSAGSTGALSTSASAPDTSAPPLPIVGAGAGNASGPAQFSDPTVVTTVLAAAKAGVQAINSYDYRNLDAAISAGLAATTGEFQTSYRAAMTGAVAATAPDSRTVQQCTVEKLGITAVSDDLATASALVFGRLTTTNTTTGTTPQVTTVTLGVTLRQIGGSWLISAVNDFSTTSGEAQPPGTAALVDATIAGAGEVVNLLTFSRANFESDFGRALAGLTGPLLSEQQGQKQSILATLTAARADYVGAVRCIGIEDASADSVLMLVAATSYEVGADGQRSVQSLPNLEIGVVRINGTWLVDQFQAVGTS